MRESGEKVKNAGELKTSPKKKTLLIKQPPHSVESWGFFRQSPFTKLQK